MSDQNQKRRISGPLWRALEVLVILLVGFFLYLALQPQATGTTPTSDYIMANGENDTGAVNLVTSIYLGYRGFDTLGETLVLLGAVSGVMVFVGAKR